MKRNDEATATEEAGRSKSFLRDYGGNLIKDFGDFKVLMWKHLILRKRRFIMTFLEMLCPCLAFLFIFACKSMLEDMIQKEQGSKTKTVLRMTEDLLENITDPLLVMYTPTNKFTDELMDSVGSVMNMHRLLSFPEVDWRGYYGFSKENLPLVTHVAKLSALSAIVKFQEMDEYTWPENMAYTIQMHKDYFDNTFEKGSIIEKYRQGAEYQLYLYLQWAIDSSFLKILFREQVVAFSESSAPNPAKIVMFLQIFNEAIRMAIILPFIFFYTTLMRERGSGMQALVKQTGVSYRVMTHAHGTNTVLISLVFSVIGTVIAKVSDNPFVPKTNGFFIFLALLLYFHTMMAFAFVCSFVNKTGNFAAFIGFICLFASFFLSSLVEKAKITSKFLLALTGILPNVPLKWFFDEVTYLEVKGTGLGFTDLCTIHNATSLSASLAYLFMILQIILFLSLTLYFHEVFPGKYGVGKPWNYCYNKKKEPVLGSVQEEIEAEKMIPKDPKYFESAHPTNVGIHVEDVCKIFNRTIVLYNVSFDVYKGELTVLLGHNGAGKTTIMSIITGLLSYTKGKVLVNGYNIATETSKAQSSIGLCPQHNISFPKLSVLEHVRFFAMLRGSSNKEALQSSMVLLRKVGLEDKRNYLPTQLSGGMQRRLQLACALSGGSEVLILDEPTSGLDVENRRNLWNLLLSLRGTHTVLLTTHFMEEADALGDRVVALHAGRLRCHATPMYLKKNIGTGYRLSLTTRGLPKQNEITQVITSAVPNAVVKETSLNSISYSLPSQDTSKFSRMFSELEAKKTELEIESIGMGVTSLEEVFLKLCSNTETTFTEETVSTELSDAQYPKKTGTSLYMQQVLVLFKRQLEFIKSRKYGFLSLHVLFPIALMAYLNSVAVDQKPQTTTLNEDFYDSTVPQMLLLRSGSRDSAIAVKRLKHEYVNVDFQNTDNVMANIVFRASQSPTENNKYVSGLDINDTNAEVVYSAAVKKAASMALNLLSNVLAAQYLPRSTGRTITTNYEPITEENVTPLLNPFPLINNPMDIIGCCYHILICLIIVVMVIASCSELPIKERIAGTRHIHLMAGVPPAVHWLTTWLWHLVLYALVLLLPISLCFFIAPSNVFSQAHYVVSIFVIMLVGIMPLLCFCYLLSFCNSKRATEILVAILFLVFGLIPSVIFFGYFVPGIKLAFLTSTICSIFYYLFPMGPLILAAFKATNVARLNALCNTNLDFCPENLAKITALPSSTKRGFDAEKCCYNKKGTLCILCTGDFGVGLELITLAVQTIIYAGLVLLMQHGIFNGLSDRFCNMKYKPLVQKFRDHNVEREKSYVTDQSKLLPQQRPGLDAMLINDVHKNYFGCLKKGCNAVKGVSLSVKKGECFGILGVNGAGKSTLFKMIVAEEVTTRGNIISNDIVLKWPRSNKYLQSLSYCPQYFDMDDFQTGYNNLITLLKMRGLSTQDAKKEADIWIQIVGLEQYRDVLVKGYSGGCVRRLATAAALSSGAPLTLLDEPTSGVDVSARRRVWVALRKGLRQNRAVIITSHSMDEMEALCDRIAIMSAGEVAALGSAPALRAAHTAGHSLSIKLVSDISDPGEVQRLKEAIRITFDCTLTDEYSTMLQYHINVTMEYSKLFTTLEDLKQKFSHIIEDYSVTETTLEEVFLSYAPKQTEGEEKGKKVKEKRKQKGTNRHAKTPNSSA